MSGIFQEYPETELNEEAGTQTVDGVEISDEPEVVDEQPGQDLGKVSDAQKIAELEEQTKRLSAEFENFRRRQQEELKRRHVLMKEEIFREILPIVDNLDRSLEAAKSQSSLEAMMKGVELVRRGFSRLFESNEIEPIEAQGQLLDPHLHEAMMVEENAELPDQTIVAELQKGYRIGDRILRPAMVKVSKKP